ncbi:MAG: hypothetical protein ACRYGA_02195 [Janthinobacterium lividum]
MDWKSIIADIQLRGELSQTQIAIACGCGQATIGDLIAGRTKNPRFGIGQALVALHKKTMARKPAADKAGAEAKAGA